MKKMIYVITAMLLCACSSVDTSVTATTKTTGVKYYKNDICGSVYTVEIEGHTYIIVDVNHGGGIIHAEHCPCKEQ